MTEAGRNKPPKPDLTWQLLEKHGISYYENIYPKRDPKGELIWRDGPLREYGRRISTIPEHIESARKTLLRFEHKVPESMKVDWETTFETESKNMASTTSKICEPPKCLYWAPAPGIVGTEDKMKENLQRREIQEARDKAIEISRYSRESEPEWVDVLQYIFRRYKDTPATRSQGREHNLLNRWVLAQELQWTEVYNLESMTAKKKPVPDLTYGFPIHTQETLDDAGVSEEYMGSSLFSFSFGFLKQLRDDNIITSPARGLLNTGNRSNLASKARSDHAICFPWAVVEIKRDETEEDDDTRVHKCYSQAANASAAALALQQPLTTKLYKSCTEDMFPIVAFTCIGPTVKTWLSYSTYRSGKKSSVTRDMICIYETDLRTTWGVYSMRWIVENMRDWAWVAVRQRLFERLNFLRRAGGYRKSMGNLPPSPITASFSLDETSFRDVSAPLRGRAPDREQATTNSRTLPRPRRKSTGIEPNFDGDDHASDRSDAEDSAVAGLSDDDVVPRPRPRPKIALRDGTIVKEIEEILDDRKERMPREGSTYRLNEYLVSYKDLDHLEWRFARGITNSGKKSLITEYKARKKSGH